MNTTLPRHRLIPFACKLLCLALLLQGLLPLTLASSLWSLSILELYTADELSTTQTVALYSGGSQEITYENAPSSRNNQYLILKLQVEKTGTGTELFQISQIALLLEGKEYQQSEQGFLEDHLYPAFPSSQLRFGERSGHIVFEIPKTADLDKAFLLFDEEEIPLELSEQDSDQELGNLPIVENILETQWELERQILQDYQQGEYDLESPYVAINPYQWSELTALLLFESTEKAKVTVTVKGKDEYSNITHNFENYDNFHQIPVVGLYPNYKNSVQITLRYQDGSSETKTIQIQTAPLLEETSLVDLNLKISEQSEMAEGVTFLVATSKNPLAVDSNGDIRWILDYPIYHLLERMENGNMMVKKSDGTGFFEMDLLGKIFAIYHDANNIHHDVIELPSGNFLTTSSHIDTVEDRILELDRDTGEILWDFDLGSIFPKDRYLDEGYYDWFHLNALAFDASDQSLIVSGRHYGTAKIAYPSGELQWLLSPITSKEIDGSAYLEPLDEDFKQPSTQHSPEILPDLDKNPNTIDLLLYDNNSQIAPDFLYAEANKYSQLVHYRIDEHNKTVEEIWRYGEVLGSRYFTIMVGDADYLPNGNYLGTFGYRDNMLGSAPNYENTGTVLELTPEGDIVFALDVLFDNSSDLYRSERLPLYPDFWEYELLTTKGTLMAENQQDLYQTEVEIHETIPLAERLWNVPNEGYVERYFDQHYQNLVVQGWVFLEGISSQDYSSSLLLTGEDASYLIPLELWESSSRSSYLNKTFGLNQDLSQCYFSLRVPYEQLWESIPLGDYDLAIYLHSPQASTVHDLGVFCTVAEPKNNLEQKDLLSIQETISQELLEDFLSHDYSMENPLIQLDPYQISPLTALVAFQTEETGTMEVTIEGKDPQSTLQHKFSALTSTHFLPIYGLYPDAENKITLRFISEEGKSTTETITIETQALPAQMQKAELLSAEPIAMAEGLIFVNSVYNTAYDHNGDVRWYLEPGLALAGCSDIQLLENGHIMMMADKLFSPLYYTTSLVEIDFLGKIYHEYMVNGAHHEVQELSDGNLIIASEQDDFSTEDYILLMERSTGAILKEWDLQEVLWEIPLLADTTYHDARKVDSATYNPEQSPELLEEVAMAESIFDWFHNNSVYYDESRDTLLVSGRQKDMVMEFDANTLEILWILTDPSAPWASVYQEKLLTPVGADFQYSYGQHSAIFLENGNLAVFDNGNFRSKTLEDSLSPQENYSRVVEYAIDVNRMTVSQVFSYGEEAGSETFSSYLGSVQELPVTDSDVRRQYLANFGGIVVDSEGTTLNTPQSLFASQSNRGLARIVELQEHSDGSISEVFDLRLYGVYMANAYRAVKLPLYGDSTHYVNLNYESSRLGDSKETTYVEKNLPLTTDNIDFSIELAQDQGDRIVVKLSYHNFASGEKYLVLQNGTDLRCYPTTGQDTLYINKAGLLQGNYEIGTLVIDRNNSSHYSSTGLSFPITLDEVPSFLPLAVLAQLEQEQNPPPEQVEPTAFVVAVLCSFPLFFLFAQPKSDRPYALKPKEELL